MALSKLKARIIDVLGNQSGLLMLYHKMKAWLAVMIYRNPSKELKVIGVTGTDGKTTSVNLIASMLEEAGHKVGFTSTLRYKVGDEVWSNTDKLSTQSPFVLQKMLRRMVKEGCEFAIVEVTSHSVVQSRINGINFDIGVFTNLSGDHLEYHGSFTNYMRAKGRFIGSIFGMRRKKDMKKALVLNADDPHFEFFDEFQGDLKFTYGIQKGLVKAEDIVLSSGKSSFKLKVPNDEIDFESNLVGEFNVYNVLAAVCVGLACGIPLKTLKEVFLKLMPVSGRLEVVNAGQEFAVVVDYAHTADALAKVCKIFKGLKSENGRLILVFGATGGGRDKKKRPKMGKVADELADVIVLCDDDPYTEDRIEIIEQIATGIDRREGEDLFKIVNREEAIRFALEIAGKEDIVLITGKGGEEVMMIGEDKIEYDDREVVRRVLGESLFKDLEIE